ncbi:MAG: hypothetical protein H6658_16050 [Ardenticatenaceae bacterium]|nr:hypothetical protein [Ardenticatenaceae bacterium]
MTQQIQKLSTEYHIDNKDRLIYVDKNWDEFADSNEAPELVGDAVLYQPIWDFISGREVLYIYRLLLQEVRQSGKAMEIPYRCDAPDARRFLLMTISAVGEEIWFCNWLLREEKREPVPLLSLGQKRSDDFLIMCSWCNRVKQEASTWVEVEQAIQAMGLFAADELPQLSHGMCPDCFQLELLG